MKAVKGEPCADDEIFRVHLKYNVISFLLLLMRSHSLDTERAISHAGNIFLEYFILLFFFCNLFFSLRVNSHAFSVSCSHLRISCCLLVFSGGRRGGKECWWLFLWFAQKW